MLFFYYLLLQNKITMVLLITLKTNIYRLNYVNLWLERLKYLRIELQAYINVNILSNVTQVTQVSKK